MTSHVLLDSTVRIVDAPGAVVLDNRVGIIDPAADSLELDVTVLTDSIRAGLAPMRAVCVELWLDLGAGLEQIPNSQVLSDWATSESHDNIVDQFTFSLVGQRFSPLLRGAMRGKQQVELYVNYGEPGFDHRARVFSGRLLSVSFDLWPPVAHCVALDEGAMWSEQLITVDIPPNSGRSRLSVLLEKAAALIPPCPLGTIDLGSADGGTLHKAVSLADMRFGDFVRDFFSPCGVVAWFSNGRLNLTRITAQPPLLVVDRRNIAAPVTVITPATQVANQVLAVAVQSDTSALAFRSVTRVETVTAPYAPMHGDPASGIGTGGYGQLVDRVTSRIETTDTYLGDTIVRTEVDEWAWYAPQMARLQINASDGTITPTGAGFRFPDGSYRTVAWESFMLIRKTITTRETGVRYGGAGDDVNAARFPPTLIRPLALVITKETVEKYFYHWILKAPYQVPLGGGGDVLLGTTTLTEAGDGVVYAQEIIGLLAFSSLFDGADETTVTEWAVTGEDGQIDYEKVTTLAYSAGAQLSPAVPAAFGYGTGTQRTYKSLPYETRNAGRTVKVTRYAATGEDSYSVSETVTVAGTVGAVRTDSVASGARPFATKINPVVANQELHATITDTTRVVLSNLLAETLHNEFCENAAELRVVARARARDLSALVVTLDMPFEGRVHKGQPIAVDLEECGLYADAMLYVWSVDRSIARFRQTVGLRLFAPEFL